MHLVLTGATGTCGSAVLKYCIAEPGITRISILSRRPVVQAEGQPKVKVLIHDDFTKYPSSVLEELKGAQACIWALGVSQTAVSKEDYIKITYEYPLAAAAAFAKLSSPFKFVFVSANRADQMENSRYLYGKIKGRAERHLLELAEKDPSLKIYAARPALIDPEGQNLRQTEYTTGRNFLIGTLGFIFRNVYKSLQIGTEPLAKALTTLALSDGEPLSEGTGIEHNGRVITNVGLRNMAGL